MYTEQEIEAEFQRMKDAHSSKKHEATGMQSVLVFLLDNQQKIWWYSWELNNHFNSRGGWLSHRACARASDLAIKYPKLVEDRKIGRFSVYRLRSENMEDIKAFLKSNID